MQRKRLSTIRTTVLLALLGVAAVLPASALEPQIRVPLYSFFDRTDADDYFTTPNKKSAANSGYAEVRWEGLILQNVWPGAVPLKQYFHAGRRDSFLLATEQSEQLAKKAGYVFVRNEGYVFLGPIPGTVPLKTYWHSGRGDHATVASALTENEVKAAGYSYLRTEGYMFSTQDTGFGARVLEVPVFSGGESSPSTKVVTAYKTSFAVHPDTAGIGCRHSWIGTLDGKHPHDVVIAICATGVVGRVGSSHVDPSRMSKEAIFEGRIPPISPSHVPGPTVDIAIGYTPRVFRMYERMLTRLAHPSPWPAMTPAAFMKASLQVAVDHTNAVLGASGVPARLQLANTKEFDILEESFADAPDAVERIAPGGTNDPYGVKAFREHTGADLVSVWLDESRLKGEPLGAANYRGPYSVVKSISALDSTMAFAHEVAHNFGAHHPAIQGDVPDSLPGYARGYYCIRFYTIMSNGTGCVGVCLGIPYFSSPSIRIDPETRGWSLTGVPAGHASTADNARRIREESGRVAAFRTLKCPGSAPALCGSPGGPDTAPPDPDDPPLVVK